MSLAATQQECIMTVKFNTPPKRHGKPWAQDDYDILIAAYTGGLTVPQIAAELERTQYATALKLLDKGYLYTLDGVVYYWKIGNRRGELAFERTNIPPHIKRKLKQET